MVRADAATAARDASTRDATAPGTVALGTLRARIADAFLHGRTIAVAEHLGEVTLFPHQRDAARRGAALLARHGVALLADDVGLGKTYAALAVVAALRDAPSSGDAPGTPHGPRGVVLDVIAPAAVRPQWRAALQRAGVDARVVHSLQRFSRATPPAAVPAPSRIVIIDEAHHLRSPRTRRYAAVADFCADARLLLLSATPVHNVRADLRALLALALGARAGALDDTARLALVVRRDAAALAHAGTVALPPRLLRRRAPRAAVPAVASARQRAAEGSRAIVEAIGALPPPVAGPDARAATQLVRLTLLRAWRSSAAALRRVLHARRQRAAALADLLAAGVPPTRALLDAWAIGDDAAQLAMPLLLAPASAPAAAPAAAPTGGDAPPHASLAAHRRALEQLAILVDDAGGAADDARAEAIRRIAAAHPERTIIVFAHFAATVQALARRLGRDPGVAWCTARGGRVAGGPLPRRELLRRVAPRAHGSAPPPAHERVRLLLTTDLLAEGVNLQDAGVVVHADLPWTPAAREQREGRIARLGSPHAVVYAYALPAPAGTVAALRLAERWARKRREAARALAAPPSRRATPAAGPVVRLLERWWRAAPGVSPADAAPKAPAFPVTPDDASRVHDAVTVHRVLVRGLRVPHWLAITYDRRDRARLTVGRWRDGTGDLTADGRAVIRPSLGVLTRVVRALDTGRLADPPPADDARALIRAIRAAVRRAARRRRAARLLTPPVDRGVALASRRLRTQLAETDPVTRPTLTVRSATMRRELARARGVGAERRVATAVLTRAATARIVPAADTPPATVPAAAACRRASRPRGARRPPLIVIVVPG